MFYVVSILTGCWLVLAIRCCAQSLGLQALDGQMIGTHDTSLIHIIVGRAEVDLSTIEAIFASSHGKALQVSIAAPRPPPPPPPRAACTLTCTVTTTPASLDPSPPLPPINSRPHLALFRACSRCQDVLMSDTSRSYMETLLKIVNGNKDDLHKHESSA